jgi:hypothetical protein
MNVRQLMITLSENERRILDGDRKRLPQRGSAGVSSAFSGIRQGF